MNASGLHAIVPGSRASISAGITPTTVYACPSRRSSLPIAAGSAPNTRRHSAWLRRTFFSFPTSPFRLGERPAELGADGHHAEEGRGDVRHADPGGEPLLADGDAAVVEERLLREHGDGAEPVVVVGNARVRAVGDPGLRVQVAHQEDPVRLGDGQRPQEDVVDDGEEGGVRADAEGEGQDDRGAVRAVPEKPPQAHPQVTPEPVHRALPRAQESLVIR